MLKELNAVKLRRQKEEDKNYKCRVTFLLLQSLTTTRSTIPASVQFANSLHLANDVQTLMVPVLFAYNACGTLMT